MPGSSEAQELERISLEMNSVSLKIQQLLEQRTMLTMLIEFKNHVSYRGPVEGTAEQPKIDCINDQLRQLSERKAELQGCQDRIHCAQGHKKDSIISCQSIVSATQDMFTIYVEPPPPPSIPAPKVILDVKKLPGYATKAQCPECRQFITTETITSVGSAAWLSCFMMAMVGCVAGCCFIPFCMDNFKDVTHKCPMCRSALQTVKRL